MDLRDELEVESDRATSGTDGGGDGSDGGGRERGGIRV